jgi:pimeloyl-ACP methyl ester carboxylesterase
MTETKAATLKVPGARLYYEVTGSGPLLLMIPGAPADAAHLLAALGTGPTYVLGCSGGALTGLDLVARHPDRVDTLVAHEPPAMNLLPDSAGWRAAFQEVYETYRRDGSGPAMQQFIATVERTGGPTSAGDQSGPPSQEQAPQMPDMSQMPPEMLAGMARMQANSQFFLAHLLPATISHAPDIAALRTASPRVVVGVGDASAGQMPHLAALALAKRLDITPVGFPGDHQGFATHPGPFAETVHKALRKS